MSGGVDVDFYPTSDGIGGVQHVEEFLGGSPTKCRSHTPPRRSRGDRNITAFTDAKDDDVSAAVKTATRLP